MEKNLKILLQRISKSIDFFHNKKHPALSSAIEASAGNPEQLERHSVRCRKVDNLREIKSGVDFIKIDVGRFEFEVFKGADRWLSEGRIGLIYFELLFTRQYGGQPSYGAILDFLVQRDYRLVRFYEMHGHLGLTGWTNVLFVHDSLVNSG